MWNVRVTATDCTVFLDRLSLAGSCIIHLYEFNPYTANVENMVSSY